MINWLINSWGNNYQAKSSNSFDIEQIMIPRQYNLNQNPIDTILAACNITLPISLTGTTCIIKKGAIKHWVDNSDPETNYLTKICPFFTDN